MFHTFSYEAIDDLLNQSCYDVLIWHVSATKSHSMLKIQLEDKAISLLFLCQVITLSYLTL